MKFIRVKWRLRRPRCLKINGIIFFIQPKLKSLKKYELYKKNTGRVEAFINTSADAD